VLCAPPPPKQRRGMGNGSYGQFITCCLSRSLSLRGGLLTLFPCSSMGSLPQETVLHKLLQRESFPPTAALPELPQRGSLPWSAVLQEQAAPAWAPLGVTNPASKPAPLWAPLSTGPQVLAGACSSAGSPWGHSFLQASICFSLRSLPGLQVDLCSIVDLHGLQGNNLPHHGLHHELQGQTLCSGISSSSPPSIFTDLGVCRDVSFTLSHSSLHCRFTAGFFLPLLKSVITEALPPSLIGLALASGGSVLEPAGTGFTRHGGSFLQLLTEVTPIAPLLPKPCHANP